MQKRCLSIQPLVESVDADIKVYYSTLPASMPSDPSINPWLQMEGVLGLAWGGSHLFTSRAAERSLGGWVRPFGGKARRDMHTSLTGNVYVQPPSRSFHPTRIMLNGTEYLSAKGAGDFMYTEVSTGKLLNLTDWFKQ